LDGDGDGSIYETPTGQANGIVGYPIEKIKKKVNGQAIGNDET
jgi:hypothetical protein